MTNLPFNLTLGLLHPVESSPLTHSKERRAQFDQLQVESHTLLRGRHLETNPLSAGNKITTSKYTLINFQPKNLFIQFHQVAYIYFLAIATLNQLPPLVVFGRTVSLFPLLFILTVTAIKDGYEDWRRHRSDRNENNKESLVTIPCDMVLMWISDPSGIAYIQTMNLDGESNLKTRYARQETSLMPLGSISGDAIDTIPYYRKSYLIKGKFPGKPYKYYGIPMEMLFAFFEFCYCVSDHDFDIFIHHHGIGSIRSILFHDRRQTHV
ncbi:unnamed protein product [Lactuca saligna]|uniref:P-type ATPase N-terminal domain-containing protein n=1 Tax=Lactuca saligna TaxID=75948 RepID=A0AA35YY42_LACSI|nr:unnamed protein product [Lactuca saligna]